MNKSRVKDRGSKASQCLERTWMDLRELLPGLPPAIIVLLGADSRRKKLGHFAWSTWKYRDDRKVHEIGISPDLFERPEEALCTILHEAAHALLYEKDKTGGCGPDFYYHKKVFRDTCRRLGLECKFRNSRYGWTNTYWPEKGVPDRYSKILEFLKESLPWGTGVPYIPPIQIEGQSSPLSGHTRLVCKCKNRCVYVNKTMLDQGGIICKFCGSEFSKAKRR